MRLLNCQIRNVRLHGDLELTFSPRLTLIGGPNESGKSTLVEALHRALFLKATASGAPVKALQSRLHLGQPTVQLAFEAQDHIWTLRKRFSGATGQVSLQADSGAQPITGPAAEDLLAVLLGVSETLGSKQAGNVLPSRWAHLWVRQGDAAGDPLAMGKSGYDFDQLRLQLERSGGAAVQQSAHDQRVEQRIQQLLDANLTSRGSKRNSALWLAEVALEAAQTRLAEAQQRLEDYETASDQLALIGEQLKQLQTRELPELQARRQALTQASAEAGRLEAAIQLAGQTLEPIRLRHDAAAQELRQLDGLQLEIEARQQRLTDLQASAATAAGQQQQLQTRQQQCQTGISTLSQQKHNLEQRQQLLQRLLERASGAASLQRLEAELGRLRQSASQRQTLVQQLAALPPLSRQELQQLRDHDQRRRDAHSRLQAMAAAVTLLRADQPVRLDGQPLRLGEQQKLSTVFQLQVGDGVVVEIAPGGGQALGQLEAVLQTSQQQLSAGLAALGAASLEAAEALLEQRTGLEQQLAGLGSPAAGAVEPLEQQRAELAQRQLELEAELEGLATVRRNMEQEQPLPVAAAELQALGQQIGRTLQHTSGALQTAERELEAARLALQQFQQQRLSEDAQLEVVRAELDDRRQRLAQRIDEQGDRAAHAGRLSALQQQCQLAAAELARLQAERAALGGGDIAQTQQQLQEQQQTLERRLEQLLDQRGAAKQRCDSISAADPYAGVEQARLQLETADAEHRQLRRLIDAHQLLKDAFQAAQADLSSRYSEPLAAAIGEYLRPLLPDGPVARLAYDQSKGFQGLQLRRGSEFYDFEVLSGGMREQLAAALRLSMADVLKEAHDGCLPLVFDDAFTNSDPERIDLVRRMLAMAVERGLQVILLTCDPSAYGSFAEQVIELPASPGAA